MLTDTKSLRNLIIAITKLRSWNIQYWDNQIVAAETTLLIEKYPDLLTAGLAS